MIDQVPAYVFDHKENPFIEQNKRIQDVSPITSFKELARYEGKVVRYLAYGEWHYIYLAKVDPLEKKIWCYPTQEDKGVVTTNEPITEEWFAKGLAFHTALYHQFRTYLFESLNGLLPAEAASAHSCCHGEINSMKKLSRYVGKVLRYTHEGEKHYIYIAEMHSDEAHCCSVIGDRILAPITNEWFAKGFTLARAQFEEFEPLSFNGVGKLGSEAASEPEWTYEVKAPFTFIRSETPTKLTISVYFDEKNFTPQNPTVPSPIIERTQEGTIYSWNIQTEGNTLKIDGKTVPFIWWEAKRLTYPPVFDEERAVCIARENFEDYLVELGLRENEAKPFAYYWSSMIRSPYILVQLVNDPTPYLPPMKVGNDFPLTRLYFLFKPHYEKKENTFTEIIALDNTLALDLGGEIVEGESLAQNEEELFNEFFIKTYISGEKQ